MTQIVDELSEYAANTIDTATAVDYELWSIVKTCKGPWEKLKALDMIMKNCGGKSSNFDSSPVLEKISKRLDSAKTIEESKSGSANVVPDVTKTMDSESHGVEENTGTDSK